VIADVSTRPAESIPTLGFGDHERFSRLLLEHCGLNFSDSRRAELELGIRHAFAASTCADLNEYYRLLQDPAAGRMDLDRLINAITVNETHFFRDAAQFDALYQWVLPELIERKRALRTLRIWSAGCASGEEPYSIAMLLRELLPDVDEWAITILGTDINTEALDRARKATYGEWAFREDRAKLWRLRYFRPRGNRYELLPEVQRMVSFAKLNLAEPFFPAYETNTTLMDLILCRNVTIYLSESVTQQIVDRFHEALVDGGWLVVGHSEPSLYTYRRFQVRNFPDTLLYQRTGQPTVLPVDWEFGPAGKSIQPIVSVPQTTSVCVSARVDAAPSGLVAPISAAEAPDPFEQARELLEYGHSEKARDVLLKLIKTRPAHAPALALVGQAYANLGEWTEAERWCRQAVRLNNLLLDAYYTLALVLQHQSRLDEAIDAMKKVVYIDRNHVLGHFGLADLYHSNGQLPLACKSLDNARRLLERCADDQIIASSGGIAAGRLRETVVREQQQWGAEAAGVKV
jgi:chemotaxis protein methyltransferase CheR